MLAPLPTPHSSASHSSTHHSSTHHTFELAAKPRYGRTIDMVSPAQACATLQVSEQALVHMINSGKLAAYRFADVVRLRQADIETYTR